MGAVSPFLNKKEKNEKHKWKFMFIPVGEAALNFDQRSFL